MSLGNLEHKHLGFLPNTEVAPDCCACVLVARASSETGKLREMSQNLMGGGLGNGACSTDQP